MSYRPSDKLRENLKVADDYYFADPVALTHFKDALKDFMSGLDTDQYARDNNNIRNSPEDYTDDNSYNCRYINDVLSDYIYDASPDTPKLMQPFLQKVRRPLSTIARSLYKFERFLFVVPNTLRAKSNLEFLDEIEPIVEMFDNIHKPAAPPSSMLFSDDGKYITEYNAPIHRRYIRYLSRAFLPIPHADRALPLALILATCPSPYLADRILLSLPYIVDPQFAHDSQQPESPVSTSDTIDELFDKFADAKNAKLVAEGKHFSLGPAVTGAVAEAAKAAAAQVSNEAAPGMVIVPKNRKPSPSVVYTLHLLSIALRSTSQMISKLPSSQASSSHIQSLITSQRFLVEFLHLHHHDIISQYVPYNDLDALANSFYADCYRMFPNQSRQIIQPLLNAYSKHEYTDHPNHAIQYASQFSLPAPSSYVVLRHLHAIRQQTRTALGLDNSTSDIDILPAPTIPILPLPALRPFLASVPTTAPLFDANFGSLVVDPKLPKDLRAKLYSQQRTALFLSENATKLARMIDLSDFTTSSSSNKKNDQTPSSDLLLQLASTRLLGTKEFVYKNVRYNPQDLFLRLLNYTSSSLSSDNTNNDTNGTYGIMSKLLETHDADLISYTPNVRRLYRDGLLTHHEYGVTILNLNDIYPLMKSIYGNTNDNTTTTNHITFNNVIDMIRRLSTMRSHDVVAKFMVSQQQQHNTSNSNDVSLSLSPSAPQWLRNGYITQLVQILPKLTLQRLSLWLPPPPDTTYTPIQSNISISTTKPATILQGESNPINDTVTKALKGAPVYPAAGSNIIPFHDPLDKYHHLRISSPNSQYITSSNDLLNVINSFPPNMHNIDKTPTKRTLFNLVTATKNIFNIPNFGTVRQLGQTQYHIDTAIRSAQSSILDTYTKDRQNNDNKKSTIPFLWTDSPDINRDLYNNIVWDSETTPYGVLGQRNPKEWLRRLQLRSQDENISKLNIPIPPLTTSENYNDIINTFNPSRVPTPFYDLPRHYNEVIYNMAPSYCNISLSHTSKLPIRKSKDHHSHHDIGDNNTDDESNYVYPTLTLTFQQRTDMEPPRAITIPFTDPSLYPGISNFLLHICLSHDIIKTSTYDLSTIISSLPSSIGPIFNNISSYINIHDCLSKASLLAQFDEDLEQYNTLLRLDPSERDPNRIKALDVSLSKHFAHRVLSTVGAFQPSPPLSESESTLQYTASHEPFSAIYQFTSQLNSLSAHHVSDLLDSFKLSNPITGTNDNGENSTTNIHALSPLSPQLIRSALQSAGYNNTLKLKEPYIMSSYGPIYNNIQPLYTYDNTSRSHWKYSDMSYHTLHSVYHIRSFLDVLSQMRNKQIGLVAMRLELERYAPRIPLSDIATAIKNPRYRQAMNKIQPHLVAEYNSSNHDSTATPGGPTKLKLGPNNPYSHHSRRRFYEKNPLPRGGDNGESGSGNNHVNKITPPSTKDKNKKFSRDSKPHYSKSDSKPYHNNNNTNNKPYSQPDNESFSQPDIKQFSQPDTDEIPLAKPKPIKNNYKIPSKAPTSKPPITSKSPGTSSTKASMAHLFKRPTDVAPNRNIHTAAPRQRRH